MQKLTFKKDAIVASFWDTETEDWQDRDLKESSLPLSWFLPYETFIDEGVTLRDILTNLGPHDQFINLIFINYLKGIPFTDLANEIKNIEKTEPSHKINAMCLLWATEVKEIEGEEDSIQTFPVIMGLDMSEDEDGEDDELYNIHEVTSEQLLDTEFVLDDLIEFYREDSDDEPLVSGITGWTLFDVLRSILNELSTYSIVSGVIKRSSIEGNAPISATDLFEHIEDLDRFYNSEK